MAGDWIKFELTTMDKPEVCQIADLAGIDPDAVVGKLMRVWGWFDQQTEEGNAPSVSKKLLDRIVGVTGFCEHMKSVGWMVEADGLISLPHFERHNGKTAKNRALTARRVSNHKNGNGEGNARSVKSALPREEKRRDIKNSLSAGEEIPATGVGEQDFEATAQPVDPKAPVEMTLDWVPDAKSLKTYCVHYGVSVDLFTPEAIAPFTAHHESSGGLQTQGKWVQMLVKWVKNDQNRASNVRPFPSKPVAQQASRHHGFADRDYTAGLKKREDGSYAL